MSRTFKLIGDELTFDGQTVATISPRLSATLRDELAEFLDGLPLTVWPDREVRDMIETERADAHALGLSEGYDKGYADGYATGYKTGADT